MERLLRIKSQKGSTLIEALLALTVAVVIITAVVTAVINSLNNTNFSESQNLATNYAQEGMEVIKDIKTQSYSEFQAIINGEYCLGEITPDTVDEPTLIASSDCQLEATTHLDDIFVRTIYIHHQGHDNRGQPFNATAIPNACAEGSFVSSTIMWNDSKCNGSTRCHKVDLTSCFTNLGSIPGL